MKIKFDQILVEPMASSKDYYDSKTFRVYDGGTLAGTYTSNIDYLYQGTGNLNGNTVSLWDVKYFNQSRPVNSYQTREIIMRFAIDDWSDQTLRSYAPTTTPKNATLSVSLTGFVPTFTWEISTESSSIADSSNLSGKYVRWTFKPVLGTATAKSTYTMEPGARITNQFGQVGFKATHNIDYYRNLNGQVISNTGPITKYSNDR